MITQDALQPPTPLSDTSADESDKDTTRVYFKTPEKRFAAVVAIPDPEPDSALPVQGSSEQLGQKPVSPTLSTSTCSDEFMDVERLVGLVEERVEGEGIESGTIHETEVPDDDGELHPASGPYLPLIVCRAISYVSK